MAQYNFKKTFKCTLTQFYFSAFVINFHLQKVWVYSMMYHVMPRNQIALSMPSIQHRFLPRVQEGRVVPFHIFSVVQGYVWGLLSKRPRFNPRSFRIFLLTIQAWGSVFKSALWLEILKAQKKMLETFFTLLCRNRPFQFLIYRRQNGPLTKGFNGIVV